MTRRRRCRQVRLLLIDFVEHRLAANLEEQVHNSPFIGRQRKL